MHWIRGPIDLKSDTYTENADVDVTGISGKETRITRGGLHVCRKATIAVR
ncbi:MAG: hypothetical protein WC628_07490 [Candidatus Omnitrophota bacterium]